MDGETRLKETKKVRQMSSTRARRARPKPRTTPKISYLPPSILRKTNLATFSNTLNAKPTIIRTPAERIHVAAMVASAASGLKDGGDGEEERSPP